MSQPDLPKHIVQRRLRAARKLRTLLLDRPPVVPHPRLDEINTYSWMKIVSYYAGRGLLTYREMFDVARELKPKLKPYDWTSGDFYYDDPYRAAYCQALQRKVDSEPIMDRLARRAKFKAGIPAARRRMVAYQAFLQQRCPCCYEPLPCGLHNFGRVRSNGDGTFSEEEAVEAS